jgi:hypothetical protein
MNQHLLRVAAATAAMWPAIAAAQQPPQTKRGAAPVAVEFFANGIDGVVYDLRADEVTLRLDGRPREIRSLRFVNLPLPDPLAPPIGTRDADVPYGSNLPENAGRWVTLIFDHESIRAGAEKNAVNAVVKFVSALGPRDSVSFIKAPRGNVETDFTTDHEKVITALRRFVGRASRQETEQDRSCRSRLLLNAVEDVLGNVAPLEGPKLVVVVSSGMLNPRRDNPANRAPGPCEIALDDFQRVSAAAGLSGAHVFVVQPDDAEITPDYGGLESLAGGTAGEFIKIAGPDDDALRRIARLTAGYYVATFDAEPSERTGTARRMQVTLRRDGVRVRARPDVVIPKPPERGNSSRKPDDMLRDRLVYRALPLRLAAYTSLGAGDKVNVVAALEPVERGTTLTSVVFGLIDVKGQLAGKWTPNPASLGSRPLLSAGEVKPGIYHLRAAAIDSDGRQGTVEYEIAAQLVDADPLRLSGLVLGTVYDSRFMPKLVFGGDQAAAVVVEMYGSAAGAVTARVEVASVADGRVLATAPAGAAGTGERRTITGAVPIASLPPGDYVVRVVVSVAGRPVGQSTRVLRKTASGL